MTESGTVRQASYAVASYLSKAKPGQVSWYLSQSEPQAISVMQMIEGDFVNRIYPGLRGLVVGQPCGTVEEAEAAAAAKLAELLSDPSALEPFDVVAAEIDDEATDLSQAFDQASLRLESIAHIGTMQEGSPSDPLVEIVENLDVDHPVSALDDLPFLVPMLLQEGRRRRDDLLEDFQMLCHDHGRQGFLIEASVPRMVPTGEGSFSVHYGTRHLDVFYGATFAVACRKALAWAERQVEAMRTGTVMRRESLRPKAPEPEAVDDTQGTLI